jgi:hypothetical protein
MELEFRIKFFLIKELQFRIKKSFDYGTPVPHKRIILIAEMEFRTTYQIIKSALKIQKNDLRIPLSA